MESKREKTNVLKEFREFAIKGNAIDLAIGVVIGGAFGSIVTSLVNDLITPLLSFVLGRFDLTDRFLNLSNDRHYATLAAAKAAGAVTLNYGVFLNDVVDFFLVAFFIFLFVRQVNRLKRITSAAKPEPLPSEKACPYCLQQVPIAATRCMFCTSSLEPA